VGAIPAEALAAGCAGIAPVDAAKECAGLAILWLIPRAGIYVFADILGLSWRWATSTDTGASGWQSGIIEGSLAAHG
jgi:hypothetical protein